MRDYKSKPVAPGRVSATGSSGRSLRELHDMALTVVIPSAAGRTGCGR